MATSSGTCEPPAGPAVGSGLCLCVLYMLLSCCTAGYFAHVQLRRPVRGLGRYAEATGLSGSGGFPAGAIGIASWGSPGVAIVICVIH